LKSGSLNLLEPSEPVQACNGIALPLPIYVLRMFFTNAVKKHIDQALITYVTEVYVLRTKNMTAS